MILGVDVRAAFVRVATSARGVNLDAGIPDAEAATLVIHCLVDTARRRHGDLAVVRALTRRERDVHDALRVF
ncbi:MAG: hypothetical protein WDA60_13420 [Acidimicrobiia bacterium]|jgi:hypothetical protein